MPETRGCVLFIFSFPTQNRETWYIGGMHSLFVTRICEEASKQQECNIIGKGNHSSSPLHDPELSSQSAVIQLHYSYQNSSNHLLPDAQLPIISCLEWLRIYGNVRD